MSVDTFSWGFVVDKRWVVYQHNNPADLVLARCAAPLSHEKETICYSDGSGTTFEKPSGIGVAVYEGTLAPRLIAENIGQGTNNRAELAACWRALKAIPDLTRRICIRTDSEYAIGILTKPWEAKSNVELILAIREDLKLRGDRVRFEHVRGHAGEEGNEVVDRLAKIGRTVITKISPL